MKYKKIIVLAIFFVSLLAVSSVSAADNATSDVVSVQEITGVDVSSIDLEEEYIDVESNDEIVCVENNWTYVYFDASASVDGNGSIETPYNYIDSSRINSNSNLYFKNGYYSTLLLNSYSNISFYGENPEKTIIDFQNSFISIENQILIRNITFKQSSWYLYNDITASNSIFIENYDDQSIFTYWGNEETLLFDNCSFINSSSFEGGVLSIYGSNSNCVISNCNFINNLGVDGGAIYSRYSNLNISNSLFKNNIGNVSAGAIYYNGGELSISNCTFINNSAYSGGSIYLGQIFSPKTTLSIINNSKFYNNIAFAGGSILSTEAVNIYLNNCDFINSYSVKGGALSILGSYSNIFNCNFEGNQADDGGSIYQIHGDLISSNSTFINNYANNGGGIFVFKINSANFTNNNFIDNKCFAIVSDDEKINYQNNIFINNDVYLDFKPTIFIGNGNYTLLKTNDLNFTILEKYDPRDFGMITDARNQGNMGYCWIFGTIATLESCILKATGKKFDFSEMNIANLNSKYSFYGSKYGGEESVSRCALAYLLNWFNPIDEKDDLYYSNKPFSPIFNSSFHIQNVMYIQMNNLSDLNTIKKAILMYGAVGSDICISGDYFNGFTYYNPNNDLTDHVVSIVGWDDNYPKENFKITPPNNGAWIIKNSWGEADGCGCYYVSYYDTTLDKQQMFTFIFNDTIKFDKNYQYDFGDFLPYEFINSSVWYKNIYNSTDDEYLGAVSTYFHENYEWELFIKVNDELVHTQSGQNGYGYYTIDLDKFIYLKKNDTFEIIFKVSALDSPYVFYPVMNYKFNDYKGKSFISQDNINWIDLYDYENKPMVSCIKAYTFLNKIKTNITLNVDYNGYNPVNITAYLLDEYGNKINSGNVTFDLAGVKYTVPVLNGVANIVHNFNKGNNLIFATFNGDGYESSSSNQSINVFKMDVEVNMDVITNLNIAIINISTSQGIIGNGIIHIENKTYIINLTNGFGSLTLFDLENKNYTVYFQLENKIYDCNGSENFTIDKIDSKIEVYDINGTVGREVIITVNVVSLNNLTINEGSVTFFDGSNQIGEANVVDGVATLTYAPSTAGEHPITTIFNSNNYLSSNSTGKLLVDSVTVEVLVDTGTVGYNSTFVANVKGLYSTINEGTVTFYLNDEYLGSVPVVDGSASLVYTPLTAGDYTVEVVFSGSDKFLDDENTTIFAVENADSELIINDLNGAVGHELTISVNVVSSNNLTINEGYIIFFDGFNQIGEANVVDGVATLAYTPSTAGEHPITAMYYSINYGNPINSALLTVAKADVDLSIDYISDVYFTNPSNFAVNIYSNYKPVNEGKIKYYVNNELVGTVDVYGGIANFDYVADTTGSFTLIIAYEETDNYLAKNASATFTVNKMPTTLNAESVIFDEESYKTFTTELKDNNNNGVGGQPVKIEVIKYSGESATFNGISDANGITVYDVGRLAGGMWYVTGVYAGNDNYISSRFVDKFLVVRMNTTTEIEEIDNPKVNHNYKLKANIHDENGKLVKEGIVQFYLDGVDIGSIDLSKNQGHQSSSGDDVMGAANRMFEFVLGADNDVSDLYINYVPTKAGKHTLTAVYEGTTIYKASNSTTSFDVSNSNTVETTITASDVTTVYNGGKYIVIKLTDVNGKLVNGVKVKVVLNKKTYTPTTKNGQVKISTNGLAPVKTYAAKITFAGNSKYDKATAIAKVVVKKATPKLTAKAKTFKKSVKTKNYVVTLKTNQNKVMKNTKVTLKVNGKSYTAKTNTKGQATFKITKLTKKGTFTATIKYTGSKYYNAKTVKAKITVK